MSRQKGFDAGWVANKLHSESFELLIIEGYFHSY